MYRICILKVAICILASRQAVRSCAGHCACMSRERPCVRDHRYQWQGNLPIAVHTTKKPQPCFSVPEVVPEVVPGKNDWCDRSCARKKKNDWWDQKNTWCDRKKTPGVTEKNTWCDRKKTPGMTAKKPRVTEKKNWCDRKKRLV